MRFFVASLLALGLFAQTARAEDDAVRARAAFQRGVAAYSAGKVSEALEAFTEAYRAKPNPIVLYNIGQAEAALDRAASATAHFEQYLREAKNIPPERRADVKRELTRLHGRTARIAIDSTVAGSKVVIDGATVGQTPLGRQIPVDGGKHRLLVSHEGYDDFHEEVSVPAGETYRLTAKLVAQKSHETEPPVAVVPAPLPETKPEAARLPAPPPAAPAEAPPVPEELTQVPPGFQQQAIPERTEPPEPAHHGLSKRWFWSGVAMSAVLAGTATATGLMALSRSDEYNDPKTPPARRAVLAENGPTLAHLTDGLIVATAAAAAVTVWLYFKTDWAVTPSPGGMALAHRF